MTTDNEVSPINQTHRGFLRLPQVLKLIPVSKSTWWEGVKTGRFPKPVKLGPNTTAWRIEDIHALILCLRGGESPNV
jgi:predicted DNA-binding transcriptional regulator AlpA